MGKIQYQTNVGYAIDHTYDVDLQKTLISERFIGIFVNSMVKKFRLYNKDKFTLTISGLKSFACDSMQLEYLFQQLKEFDFEIKLEGEETSICSVDIICKNVSKDEVYSYNYQIVGISSIIELSSKTNIPIVAIIIMKIIAQTIIKLKILYKAIVFDLDDTLWIGTLAEDGIEKIKENMKSDLGISVITFMNFIKSLAKELGVFIAICSRNDLGKIKLAFDSIDESIFPLKNEIDCIVANYNDKSENIEAIAKQLSILPDSIVFIDDNILIRDEVRQRLPNVFVPNWAEYSDLTTQLIVACIFERNELSLSSRDRRKQYEILQLERKKNVLPELYVKVIKDENHVEAKRLYSKSNQFKLSEFDSDFENGLRSLCFEMYRDNGEKLGICSAVTYSISTKGECNIHNWAISCRYFEIGLEEFIILYLIENIGIKGLSLACEYNGQNSKLHEFIDKYYGKALCDDWSSVPIDCDISINHYGEYDDLFKRLLLQLVSSKCNFNVYIINQDLEAKNLLKANTNIKIRYNI